MIQAVLFDYGGVLTRGGTSGGMTRLVASVMQISFQEAVRARPLLSELLLGTITTGGFLEQLSALYPHAPRPNAARLLDCAEIFTPSPEVYRLAERLRRSGLRTAILSNMFGLSAEKLRKEGFYQGFDPVILSYEEHLAKPDARLYERALTRLQLPAAAVLFIDDQERFLAPARTLGMPTVLAENPGQIVTDTIAAIAEHNGPGFSLLQ